MNAAEYFIEDCPVSAALPEGLPLPAVHVLRAAHLRRNREIPVQPLAQTNPCRSLQFLPSCAVDLRV